MTVDSEGSFLDVFCLLWKLKKKIREGVPLKSVGGSCRWQKSKMAAVGHLENYFSMVWLTLQCNNRVPGVLGVEEFIFYISFTI